MGEEEVLELVDQNQFVLSPVVGTLVVHLGGHGHRTDHAEEASILQEVIVGLAEVLRVGVFEQHSQTEDSFEGDVGLVWEVGKHVSDELNFGGQEV